MESTIGERIRDARKEKKYTQKALAQELQLSGNYVYLIEAGKENPSPRTVRDIAKVLGVNEKWIITGEGEMNDPDALEKEANSYIESLFDKDYPFRDLIISIMKTYNELEPKDKEVAKRFMRQLTENIKKEGEV